MKPKLILLCLLVVSTYFLSSGLVCAQSSISLPPTTTTYPSTPPSNAAGTKNVPLYSKADGALYVDFLDAPAFVLGAGSATIGGVNQSGTWSVGITGTPTFTVSNSTLAVTQSGAPWSFALSGSNSVSVSNFPTTQAVSGTVTIGNSSIPVTGTFYQATQPVSGTFWPYTLGQQLANASVPVILPSATITALTPPTTVTVQQSTPANLQATVTPASGATFPISGSITATNPANGSIGSSAPSTATYVAGKNGSGNLTGISTDSSGNVGVNVQNSSIAVTLATAPTTTVVQPTGTNLHTVIDSGSVTATVSGVSTASGQTNGSQKSQIVDGSGNVIGSTSNALNVNISGGNPTSITANAGTNLNTSALELDTHATNVQSAPGTPQTTAITIQGNASGVPINAIVSPLTGSLTDGSSTITSGGTAQTVFASEANRAFLFIQNISAGPEWVNFTTTAVQSQPAIELLPNASLTMASGYVSSESVSIIGATTGQAFTAKER